MNVNYDATSMNIGDTVYVLKPYTISYVSSNIRVHAIHKTSLIETVLEGNPGEPNTNIFDFFVHVGRYGYSNNDSREIDGQTQGEINRRCFVLYIKRMDRTLEDYKSDLYHTVISLGY